MSAYNPGSRVATLFLFTLLPVVCDATEHRKLSQQQAEVVGDAIDAALVSQWDASRKGVAKGIITTKGAGNLEAELTMAWDDERVRYHYTKYEQDRIPPVPGQPSRQTNPLWVGSWTAKEHIQYDPSRNLGVVRTGRFHGEIDDVLELRPRRIWFGLLMRGPPTHVERFREMRKRADVYELANSNIVYRTENGEMEFAVSEDFCVIRHELTHPNNPVRIQYELQQDSHKVWFPRKVLFTKFAKNSTSKVDFEKTIEITEYSSRPSTEQLKFSVDDLGIAKGTNMSTMGSARSRSWIYGATGSNSAQLKQIELDKIIEKAKAGGLSAKSRE